VPNSIIIIIIIIIIINYEYHNDYCPLGVLSYWLFITCNDNLDHVQESGRKLLHATFWEYSCSADVIPGTARDFCLSFAINSARYMRANGVKLFFFFGKFMI
jgi:hypothetical protein